MTQVPTQTGPKAPAIPYVWATGRRKSAVARVRIRPGTGVTQANGRELKDYFPLEKSQAAIAAPLRATKMLGKYDVFAQLNGGGIYAQSEAMKLAIARALVKADPSTEAALREAHFLTRDPREKERKKPGKRGARASFQFSKR
jgi:small subunit ribosomal protein S9